ncbi:MAG: MipA/OmpV family protein [Lentisphaerae bacterium]|nr:MipA/OmpV family protein [Lentisphaerota bacterium]
MYGKRKRSARVAAAAICALALRAGAENLTARVAVRLVNPPEAGSVVLALFDNANAFGDFRDPVRFEVFHLDGRERYVIDGIRPGEYALLVYYDENANRRIDRNFIGIPREPLGFSNAYRPKGPPRYTRAAFTLTPGAAADFAVSLYRPLGRRGRIGVGLGLIASQPPYRDYDGNVVQLIPAVTYIGNRLQVYGPYARLSLLGSGALRLAATGRYRIRAYEEEDSDFLEGLGDRDDTVMAGLALQADLPVGFTLTAGYDHDVLDTIGGGSARAALSKSFSAGLLRITPEAGVHWLAADLADYDYGVPAAQARAARPAYRVGDAFNLQAGLDLFFELTDSVRFILNGQAEFLDAAITASPIVEDDIVFSGFSALNYLF